jgi:hypothetical protein
MMSSRVSLGVIVIFAISHRSLARARRCDDEAGSHCDNKRTKMMRDGVSSMTYSSSYTIPPIAACCRLFVKVPMPLPF